jgi:arylsulfatase A
MRGSPSPHEQLLLFNNFDVVAVRTQRWKYVVQTHYRTIAIPLPLLGHQELYDMLADPSESYSLAAREPAVLKDMQARLAAAQIEFKPYNTGVPPFFQKLGEQLRQRAQD